MFNFVEKLYSQTSKNLNIRISKVKRCARHIASEQKHGITVIHVLLL